MNRRSFLKSTAATAACAGAGLPAFAADAPLDVGFIYVGPIGDMGWSYQHNVARKAMQEHYGDKVRTTFIESVSEGADAERALTQLALEGNRLIFATSFGYMDSVINVARKFPNVKFEHATGYKLADNVATYDAKFFQGRAIQGTIGGRMTRTGKIGYIGSFPIPEVYQGINSAFLAAKRVNPDIEMKIVWAYAWFDPAKEADAAAALIADGVDVLLQHTDSTAPQAKAREAGNVITFGQGSDMSSFAPMPRVCSTIDNWAPYYIRRVGEVLDGTWKSEATWGGIDSGMVKIGEISTAVPAGVRAEAIRLREDIGSGKVHPFTGPLNKQDGSVFLADGERATDGELHSMTFYVEGITAKAPK